MAWNWPRRAQHRSASRPRRRPSDCPRAPTPRRLRPALQGCRPPRHRRGPRPCSGRRRRPRRLEPRHPGMGQGGRRRLDLHQRRHCLVRPVRGYGREARGVRPGRQPALGPQLGHLGSEGRQPSLGDVLVFRAPLAAAATSACTSRGRHRLPRARRQPVRSGQGQPHRQEPLSRRPALPLEARPAPPTSARSRLAAGGAHSTNEA